MQDQSTHPQPIPSATLHLAGDRVIRIDIAGAIDLTSVDVLDDALTAALGQQPHACTVRVCINVGQSHSLIAVTWTVASWQSAVPTPALTDCGGSV